MLRDKVFGLVFRIEFYPENELEEQVKFFEEYAGEEEYLPEDLEYITGKFKAVKDKLSEIDQAIDKCAVGWTRSRMGKCELAALRLGIYEMLYDDEIPQGVAISEAVELARRFGADGAGSFVNGVLAKFAV